MGKYFLLFVLFYFFQMNISIGQDTIYLKNPSFEDTPRKGADFTPPIIGWRDCGLTDFPDESPPDILPTEKQAWYVTKEAKEGDTYISLVVRFNGSFESISQSLPASLNEGNCYRMSAYMVRSETFRSATFLSSGSLVNIKEPVVLNIWGGNKTCERTELLAQSVPVQNHEWMKYEFEFTPKSDCSSITLNAFFSKEIRKPYNGHVLVDNLSPIIEVNCK